jgi:hypothetical protein
MDVLITVISPNLGDFVFSFDTKSILHISGNTYLGRLTLTAGDQLGLTIHDISYSLVEIVSIQYFGLIKRWHFL